VERSLMQNVLPNRLELRFCGHMLIALSVMLRDMEFVYREFDESSLAMNLYRAWRRWQGRGRNIPVTLEAQKIAYFHAVAGDADEVREIVFTE
jgi:hypothetical protein